MKKRIFATFFVALLALTYCYGTAFAIEPSDVRASLTLSSYGASVTAGSNGGVICISYNVMPTDQPTTPHHY